MNEKLEAPKVEMVHTMSYDRMWVIAELTRNANNLLKIRGELMRRSSTLGNVSENSQFQYLSQYVSDQIDRLQAID